MPARIIIAMFVVLVLSGVSQGATERWSTFAEDADLKYYVDQRSIVQLPDNVYIFWVKSVPKNKDYFRQEYNQNGVSYMFTSYEIDCAVSSYRVRGTIMFDKNRREVSKTLPDGEPAFEPVPPESMVELAQEEVCKDDKAREGADETEPSAAAPAPAEPEAPAAPAVPALPEIPAAPLAPAVPGQPEVPATPALPTAPAAPEEPPTLQ